VRFHGRFAESEKGAIFARLDVLLVPSLGLESFGLAAREAIAHGVPVIASRRGALEELFAEDGRGGAFVEPGDAAGLRRLVDALADRPETVVDWIRDAPRVVDTEEHAAAIEDVYRQLGRAAAT
jgi:glycosyltransferase involved in cell wall biosynthesis